MASFIRYLASLLPGILVLTLGCTHSSEDHGADVSKPSAPAASKEADPQAGNERFVEISRGVLRDSTTGLMWTKDNGHDLTWREALAYCEDHAEASYDDWRMPKLEELSTLFEQTAKTEPKLIDLFNLEKCTLWGRDKEGNAGFQMLCGFSSMPNLDTDEPRSRVLAVRG